MQLDPVINNRISIFGTIDSELTYSHDVYGEAFYTFYLKVPRLSNAHDLLPVTISERIIEIDDFVIGRGACVFGQIRSYNSYLEEERRNKLILTVFAKDCKLIDNAKSPNEVYLDGFICKPTIYRTTPFGREISDILIAVNRSYNKSDYIPCIAWGRNAKFAGKLVVGDNIRLWGRMQSRNYQKKLANGEILEKMAYEVSISKLEWSANDVKEQEIDNPLEE